MRNLSPLRYPGGKASLAGVIEAILYANRLQGCTYVEPFAGGAGAGLKLLREGHVDRVVINDCDRALYSFWNSVMRRPHELIRRIQSVPLTIPEWKRQRETYRQPKRSSQLDVGFAAFYLNRCNRSGIIMDAGPIGGTAQSGKWRIDARFNREALAQRIEDIAGYGDRVIVLREDALHLIQNLDSYIGKGRRFIYADPPYYMKGSELYYNHYSDEDHQAFAEAIRKQKELSWVMTYDDVPRIRQLYGGLRIKSYNLRYSAHATSTKGGEILISPKNVTIPVAAEDSLGLLTPIGPKVPPCKII